jgi:hypothetical protein
MLQELEEGEMGGTCSVHLDDEKHIQILVGRPERKRLFERLGRSWEDNIKMIYLVVFMPSPNKLLNLIINGSRI